MIIVTIACLFMFLTTVSCSTLRMGPYLFYIEKFITQFKTTEKKMIYRHTHFWEKWRFTSMARSSCEEKECHVMHTHWSRVKLCTEEMRNVILGNDLNLIHFIHQSCVANGPLGLYADLFYLSIWAAPNLACKQQTYFRSLIFGGTTGNTSAVRRLHLTERTLCWTLYIK